MTISALAEGELGLDSVLCTYADKEYRDGKFGLWIDAAFENGLSSRSLTFDNEVLNWQSTPKDPNMKEEGKFEVFKVEVWRCGS